MSGFKDLSKNLIGDVAKLLAESKKAKLDPVGREDADVDNDGDSDKSDSYLVRRRKAIAKAMKEDVVDEQMSTMARPAPRRPAPAPRRPAPAPVNPRNVPPRPRASDPVMREPITGGPDTVPMTPERRDFLRRMQAQNAAARANPGNPMEEQVATPSQGRRQPAGPSTPRPSAVRGPDAFVRAPRTSQTSPDSNADRLPNSPMDRAVRAASAVNPVAGAGAALARRIASSSKEINPANIARAARSVVPTASSVDRTVAGAIHNVADAPRRARNAINRAADAVRNSETAREIRTHMESAMDGVAKGSMEGKKHMCATKVFHKEWAEGTPIKTMHADPDDSGNIEWYDVMFEHGIERVMTEEMDILQMESHMHSKKMEEGYTAASNRAEASRQRAIKKAAAAYKRHGNMNQALRDHDLVSKRDAELVKAHLDEDMDSDRARMDSAYKEDLPNMLKDLRGKRKGQSDMRREYGASWKRLTLATAAEHGHDYNRNHLLQVGQDHMNEEVEQIDEISKKKAEKYIDAAMDTNSEKSVSNLASKGGFEQGERGAEDSSAGEKEDAKSVKRSKSVMLAAKKLSGSAKVPANEEVELEEDNSAERQKIENTPRASKYRSLANVAQDVTDRSRQQAIQKQVIDEAKRGRPKKNATPEEKEETKALGIQLRKAASMNKAVTFDNGEEAEIHPNHVNLFNDHMDARRTTQEKAAFQKMASASHDAFKKAVTAPIPSAAKDTGEIVKYR